MLKLIYDIVNPLCESAHLPTLNVRIGIDSGQAYIRTVGSPATKQQKDILGHVVSLASKIQEQATPGDIYLGETMVRPLHTGWRENCEPVDVNESWQYSSADGDIYRIYKAGPWDSGSDVD